MNQQINVNDLERKVQKSVYQDGLVEILMGVTMFFISFVFINRISIVFIPFLLFFNKGVYDRAKTRYIYPRIGYARFPSEEQEGDPKIGLVALALLILSIPGSFFLLTGTLGEEVGWLIWSIHLMPRFFGVLLSIAPLVMATEYNLKRGYLYTALLLTIAILEPIFLPGLEPGYDAIFILVGFQTLAFGASALLVGLVLFMSFLRKYPIPAQNR
jgi:hypothetical protein